jgi:hypothetical protein
VCPDAQPVTEVPRQRPQRPAETTAGTGEPAATTAKSRACTITRSPEFPTASPAAPIDMPAPTPAVVPSTPRPLRSTTSVASARGSLLRRQRQVGIGGAPRCRFRHPCRGDRASTASAKYLVLPFHVPGQVAPPTRPPAARWRTDRGAGGRRCSFSTRHRATTSVRRGTGRLIDQQPADQTSSSCRSDASSASIFRAC